MEEQVIVTKGQGVSQPKEPDVSKLGVDPSWSGTEDLKKDVKRTPSRPLQQETLVGAAVRTQLRAILDSGPLTEESVAKMSRLVETSVPLLRVAAGGEPGTRRRRLRDGVTAGIKTILGVIPIDEWSEEFGPYPGDSKIHRIKTLAKIVVKRVGRRVSDAIDGEIHAEEAASLDASLRVKVAMLLEQPYTPPVAKRLEDLLDAIMGLLKALGPAKDRLPRHRPRPAMPFSSFGYSTFSPGPTTTMMPNPDSGAAQDMQNLWAGQSSDEDEIEEAEESLESNEPLVTSPPVETFGAKLVREIMAMAPALMNAQRNTPENMVLAIVAAEREGMPKLAEKLRRLMGLEKPEEQETPKPIMPFLRPVVATEPKAPGGCSFMFGGFGAECGVKATKAAKNPNGHVNLYCSEHLEAAVKRGDAVDECTAVPECSVATGVKFAKGKDGIERGYCDFHYGEAVAKGEVSLVVQ